MTYLYRTTLLMVLIHTSCLQHLHVLLTIILPTLQIFLHFVYLILIPTVVVSYAIFHLSCKLGTKPRATIYNTRFTAFWERFCGLDRESLFTCNEKICDQVIWVIIQILIDDDSERTIMHAVMFLFGSIADYSC